MAELEIKMISIPKKTYDQLIKDQKWLRALEAAGVDNWEGFDIAKESLPDKYCPACGSQWARNKVLGSVPTCQCSCIAVGTIHYNPVSLSELRTKSEEKK